MKGTVELALLTVADVQERYDCSAPAARKIMREVGSFERAGKLFVHLSALIDSEQADILAAPALSEARRTVRVRRPHAMPAAIDDGFFRQ